VAESAFGTELTRVADRLRLLGPRWAGRDRAEDAAAARLVRGLLQDFADAAADAQGRPRRAVPVLAGHGLADQVLVLGHDLLAAGDPDAVAAGTERLTALRRAL
jgi:nucleotide-binding universal stress UspA family protein